jgi:hypothetical protein
MQVAVFKNTKTASDPYEEMTSGTSSPVGSVTPDQDGSLVISIAGNQAGTFSGAPTGFTLAASIQSAGALVGSAMAYKIQTTAGSENPTWSGASLAQVFQNFVFKPE